MAGSSNFQLWNPTQTNQETDAQYTADAQRAGGAPNGVPFPSMTGNKLFYQLAAGVWALMQMMAGKGFNVSDANPSTLASVLAAIQTTADIKQNWEVIGSTSGIVSANCGLYNGFEIDGQSGPMTINLTGQTPGQIITFYISQNSSGGNVATIPDAVGEYYQDTSPSAQSTIIFIVVSDNSLRAISPGMSGGGLIATPIGQTGTAKNGTFATLVAAATTLLSLAVTNGISAGIAGISTTGNVSGNCFIANQGSGAANGFQFNGGATTGLFSSSSGVLDLYVNGTKVLDMTPSLITLLLAATFSGNASFNGSSNNFGSGNWAGNPSFTGTPTTTTPGATDSSGRIANTSWVNGFSAQKLGSGTFLFSSQTFSNSSVTYLTQTVALGFTPAAGCVAICMPQSDFGNEVQYTCYISGSNLIIKLTHGQFNLPYTVPNTNVNYKIIT